MHKHTHNYTCVSRLHPLTPGASPHLYTTSTPETFQAHVTMVIGHLLSWSNSWGSLTGGGGGGGRSLPGAHGWRPVTPRRVAGLSLVTCWTTPMSSSKLAEQVLLILGVFLLQLTCGHQEISKRYDDLPGTDIQLTQEDLKNLQEDELTPYRVPKAVSIRDFSEVLKTASSYHDVLRAFYGSVLTNEAIDNMMASHPQPQFYSSAFGRPRIGGLSDSMSFAMAPRSLQGIHPSLMRDDASLLQSVQSRPRHRGRHRHRVKEKGQVRKNRRRLRRRGRKNKKKKAHDEALEHYKEMEEKARCRYPVPVVLRIRDISNSASKVYFPHCTIVYRCRADSGCCNESSTCASSKNTTIQRSFFALEYVKEGSKVVPGKRIVESLTFVNHTECACAPIQQIPECQQCPRPFSPRRENQTECTCDCFDGHNTCIRIKKGKSPLDEKELRLIKEGKLLRPKCQYGVFEEQSIRTGYCPRKRSKQHRQTVAEELVSGFGAGDLAKKRGNWG